MTTAIVSTVRFYLNNATQGQWQNFWMQKTVDGYVPVNFKTSEILLNRSADEGGITLQLPALADHVNFFLQAIENEYLADVRLYEQDVSTDLPSSISGMTMISRFTGEVQTMSMTIETLTVAIGAGIDAVNGEIPGRRITTSLVGRLPTL